MANGASLENCVVINRNKILHKNGLRYDNEFVRHKVLDAVGDLYLSGAPIRGHYRGVRAGHELTNKLLQKIIKKKYQPNRKLIGDGKNIIISYGVCAEQIFNILYKSSILKKKYTLYNFSLITHLNKRFILQILKRGKKLLVIEDHFNKGSLSEKIKVLLYENNIKMKIVSKNLGSEYFSPKKTLNELFEDYGITEEFLKNLKI